MGFHLQPPLRLYVESQPHHVRRVVLGPFSHFVLNSCSIPRETGLYTYVFRTEPSDRQDKRHYDTYLSGQNNSSQRNMEFDELDTAFQS